MPLSTSGYFKYSYPGEPESVVLADDSGILITLTSDGYMIREQEASYFLGGFSVFVDVTGDGFPEAVGQEGTYSERIVAYDFVADTLVSGWGFFRPGPVGVGDHPMAATQIDVDDDGLEEYVFGLIQSDAIFAFNIAAGDPMLLIVDAETGNLEYEGSPFKIVHNADFSSIATSAHALAVGDVDGDGSVEIIVATDSLYTGALYLIDGKTRNVKQLYLFDDQVPLYSLALHDFDGDGVPEIVAGGVRWVTRGEGSFLYEIDGRTGQFSWRIDAGLHFFSGFSAVRVGDVTGDGIPKIVALSEVPDYPNLSAVYIIDPIGLDARHLRRDGLAGLDLVDVDADGTLDILVGTLDGTLEGV